MFKSKLTPVHFPYPSLMALESDQLSPPMTLVYKQEEPGDHPALGHTQTVTPHLQYEPCDNVHDQDSHEPQLSLNSNQISDDNNNNTNNDADQDGVGLDDDESHDDRSAPNDQNLSVNNGLSQANQVPMNIGDGNHDENQEHITSNPDVWTLPSHKDDCTLDEIRRGQVVNGIPPNECPVIGCGKKINENKIEPSPGTIASGLKTHVLFVHYENRRPNKKRKLGWSNRRKSQVSPKKQMISHSSPSTSGRDFDNSDSCAFLSEIQALSQDPALNLSQPRSGVQKHLQSKLAGSPAPGSIINKKVKQLAAKQSLQMSSLQSLMQATGVSLNGNSSVGSASSGMKVSSSPSSKKKASEASVPSNQANNLNPTTSSLFSILAGLTQQQQISHQPATIPKNVKTGNGSNTINISQCSRNPTNSGRSNVNSSLLSLLNEKISRNVANSLQVPLKKSVAQESKVKVCSSTPRKSAPSPANSYYQTNEPAYNNSSSILSSLCSGNGDSRSAYDSSTPLNSFIESIALKTGSNIGPLGISEAKRIIEKFTNSLICSSQTIADHYIDPFAGDVPQQKPEISPSDIILAYKMMHKSHGHS